METTIHYDFNSVIQNKRCITFKVNIKNLEVFLLKLSLETVY